MQSVVMRDRRAYQGFKGLKEETGFKQVAKEVRKASQMARTVWAKAQRPNDEDFSGGLSSESLALAFISSHEAGPAIRVAEMKLASTATAKGTNEPDVLFQNRLL